MKKILVLLGVMCLSIQFNFAQESTYEEKVIHMLELSGAKKNFDVAIDGMINLQKTNYSNLLDEEFFDALSDELKKEGMDKLAPMLTPIYKKHIEERHLDAIITFFESEAGIALNEKNPLILAESMQVGAEWGKEIGESLAIKIMESFTADFEVEIEDDCTKFRNGDFEEETNEGNTLFFTRNGEVQNEVFNEKVLEFKIEWITNNKYRLTYVSGFEDETSPDQLVMNIYEVNGNTYKYISQNAVTGEFQRGEITKVK